MSIRPTPMMDGWGRDWQGTSPAINSNIVDNNSACWTAAYLSNVGASSSSLESGVKAVGWWLGSGANAVVANGEGRLSVGVVAPSFTPPTPISPSRVLSPPATNISQVSPSSTVASSAHRPLPDQQQAPHHTRHYHTPTPFLLPSPGYTFTPITPTDGHLSSWGVRPFNPPELVVEELPDTWSSKLCISPPTPDLASSPLVQPLSSQCEIASPSLSTPPCAPHWSHTPPSPHHSSRALSVDSRSLTLSLPAMSDGSVQPEQILPPPPGSSQGHLGSSPHVEANGTLSAQMTTPVSSSPSLCSPRIETPNGSPLPEDGRIEQQISSVMDDRQTTATIPGQDEVDPSQ